jgi:acetoin utilization protein AcuC
MERFEIDSSFTDREGNSLLTIKCRAGSTDVVLDLRHAFGAEDPLLFAHLADTMNGQIHVLLYIVNDPNSPRFDVDRMPDGTPTKFGIFKRNIDAEINAMQAGLAPGQVRRGLRMLGDAIDSFEIFVTSLGHEIYFNEPLYYHNAIIFERYGFRYQQGRRLMESIHAGFQPGGKLFMALDESTPFRTPEFADSIRGRSWALHDGVMGNPYSDVTMYKIIGENADIATFPDSDW